jgi:hypothetical protein
VRTLYAGGFLAFDLIVLWTDQRSENVLANDLACHMLVSVYKITNQFDFRSPNKQQCFLKQYSAFGKICSAEQFIV